MSRGGGIAVHSFGLRDLAPLSQPLRCPPPPNLPLPCNNPPVVVVMVGEWGWQVDSDAKAANHHSLSPPASAAYGVNAGQMFLISNNAKPFPCHRTTINVVASKRIKGKTVMLTLNPQPGGASLLRCYSGQTLLAAPLVMV